MTTAAFDINGSPSTDGGYDASLSEVLTLTLEDLPATDLRKVRVRVYGYSDGAPTLSFTAEPSPPATPVEITMPASGMHAWGVEVQINDGQRVVGSRVVQVPEWTFKRLVVIRSAGLRKSIPTERTEYGVNGWVDVLNELAAAVAGGLSGSDLDPAGTLDIGTLNVTVLTAGRVANTRTDVAGAALNLAAESALPSATAGHIKLRAEHGIDGLVADVGDISLVASSGAATLEAQGGTASLIGDVVAVTSAGDLDITGTTPSMTGSTSSHVLGPTCVVGVSATGVRVEIDADAGKSRARLYDGSNVLGLSLRTDGPEAYVEGVGATRLAGLTLDIADDDGSVVTADGAGACVFGGAGKTPTIEGSTVTLATSSIVFPQTSTPVVAPATRTSDAAPVAVTHKGGRAYASAATYKTGGTYTIGGGKGAVDGTDKSGDTRVDLGATVAGESAGLELFYGASSSVFRFSRNTASRPHIASTGDSQWQSTGFINLNAAGGSAELTLSTTGNSLISAGTILLDCGGIVTTRTSARVNQILDASNVIHDRMTFPADVATTDATVTTLATITPVTTRPSFLWGSVRAWTAGVASAYVWHFRFGCKSPGGVAALLWTPVVAVDGDPGLSACVLSFDVVGATVRVRGQGIAATNITWNVVCHEEG